MSANASVTLIYPSSHFFILIFHKGSNPLIQGLNKGVLQLSEDIQRNQGVEAVER